MIQDMIQILVRIEKVLAINYLIKNRQNLLHHRRFIKYRVKFVKYLIKMNEYII